MYLKVSLSTRIVGTDTRMSSLDTRMSSLDTRMSRLDIRMSKVILESGKTETAENSRSCVAFRMFFQKFCRPIGWKIRDEYVKKHSQLGHTYVQVGHTYVQADNRGWTYVCPSYQYTHRVGHTYVQPLLSAWTYVCPTPTPRLDIRMSNPYY